MIEIPPRFAGRPPVNAQSRNAELLIAGDRRGAEGIAEDLRYYGQWILDEAKKRIGSLYLLSQFVLAARQEDFAAALQSAGIKTPSDPGLFDIIGGFSEAIDQHLVGNRQRTDIGEMAQLAAVDGCNSSSAGRGAQQFPAPL